MNREAYPSDLTNPQWDLIKPLLPEAKEGGRAREQELREIINAILYLNRTGCQWRYLPHDLPVWQTVYTYFRNWKKEGVWKHVNDTLRVKVRKKAKRHEEPSAGCMDSQSVKTAGQAKKDTCGYDAAKHVYGKKRHILVDTQGLLLEIIITPANVQDRDGAKLLLNKIEGHYPRLKKIFVDNAYAGKLVGWAQDICSRTLEVVKRKPGEKGFQKLPRRWVVERTFGWLNRYRRLSKDYEKLPDTSENMVYISMIDIMLKRLTKNQDAQESGP